MSEPSDWQRLRTSRALAAQSESPPLKGDAPHPALPFELPRSDIQRPKAEIRKPAPPPASSPERCALCGLPVGSARTETLLQGTVMRFCCPGCRAVFLILFNSPGGAPKDFLESELYQACVASGLIPAKEQGGVQATEVGVRTEARFSASLQKQDPLAQDLNLKIEGMWCTACAWVVEALLCSTKGVLEARVFFFSDLATIKHLPHLAAPSDLLKAIARLGYRATLLEDQGEASKEKKRSLLRLGLSCILTMNIMMIAFALYAGFFQELGEDGVRYLSYPLWLLATPVVFYGGFPMIKRAWQGLRFLNFSMDTLIAIGALSAYFYSVGRMAEGSLHLYFDTAAMLVSLVLLGKYIENEAREQASHGMLDLLQLSGGKARLSEGNKEVWTASSEVRPGDQFLVLGEERIPLDGVILSGGADLDESILTGESHPVWRSAGDEVLAGSLVMNGHLLLRATRPAAASSVSQMRSLIQRALAEKNPIELFADAVTRWLVPGILLLAVGTVLFWRHYGVPVEQALLHGLTVLVITCPCALGIATPLARVAAIGVSRANGVIVRNPEAFEKAKKIDTLVFDKTGTMTEGKFSLCDVFVEKVERNEALRRVASLEVHSDHFLAKEMVRKAEQFSLELEPPASFEAFEGLGVRGMLQGGLVCAGNLRFMADQGLMVAPPILEQALHHEARGMTVVFFGWDQTVQGLLIFGDVLRAEAKQVVSGLHAKGLAIWLVSGDSPATTRAVAEDLGIQHFAGRALPVDKLELVRKLQHQGRRVAMIGDGINDAPALAQADLAMAFGSKPNAVGITGDLTILSQHLKKISDVLKVSTLTTRVIRENLALAFLYNVFGIPLAVAGLLNPLIAVSAMLASSLTVVGNTLRISRALRPS